MADDAHEFDTPAGGLLSVRRKPLRLSALILAGVLSLFVLLIGAFNLLEAGANTVTLVAAEAWAFAGPVLTAMALVSVVLSVLAVRGWQIWVGRTIAVVALVALVVSTVISGMIVGSAVANGGSVNPLTAFDLSASSRPDRTETYVVADGRDQAALIYEPAGGGSGAPVLMYIHGGGWVGGSAQEAGAVPQWWADHGWYVVSVDYRLATSDYATWHKAPADVACALAYTVEVSATDGADPATLVVAGDSAGGNLAMLLGWSSASGQAASTCPEAGAVPVPDAVVAGYPVANPGDTYTNGRSWFGQKPQDFTRDFLGGTPAEYPDRLASVSPASFVSADVPPTLIVQPERDDFIPAAGNYSVAQEATDAGAEVSVVRVPFAHHGFDFIPNALGGQVKLTVASAWLRDRDLGPAN